MNLKEKILILVVVLVVFNLAFLFGQTFYYSQSIANILSQKVSSSGDLSARLLKASGENFILLIDDKELSVDSAEFGQWIEKYSRSYGKEEAYRLNQTNVRRFLANLSREINIPAIDAKFRIIDGKITEFTPSQIGHILNTAKTMSNILVSLSQEHPGGQIKSRAVMEDAKPEFSLGKINNLGIESLLGHGESNFTGSSKARISNIGVGAKIFNNVLIKPGEVFSFTDLLGPVDSTGGYKTEMVIKNGKIIPEYGGGLCQVSTTMFRAAVYAGLPILERHAHSLPVHYYEPQGFDATIYPGSADLRFKNDTPSYILIQSKISDLKLSFDIYGTDDKRAIIVDGPHQYNQTSNGSLKAELLRTVIYPDGTKKEDIFKSSYQSPSLFPTVRNPLE
jgi:vancomycin resistance protein YoaR